MVEAMEKMQYHRRGLLHTFCSPTLFSPFLSTSTLVGRSVECGGDIILKPVQEQVQMK